MFTQSRDLPPKKQRRRLVRGAKVLRKTILFATRAGGTGKISTECSIALVDLLHDTRERSKRLINVR